MNLLDLMVKIGVDDEASSKIAGITGSMKSGLATAAKAGAAAVAALGAATVKVGADALNAYGEFEQLSGGAELMFGEAYDFVMQKSQEAYKNVQMSQNEYLQQVNGFAVGLRESMGGNEAAAAQLADKIITAEADIVAATGNTQENVQNAFNGIMKGNYSMLDNLQIGIKPTKEGMQEVIDKVNEWNEAQGRASNYTIDNLADCQAAVVDYVEMVGMAGYAQREAATTIQGSLSMVKASWQNLLTELGKEDGNVGQRVSELIDSASTALLGAVDENGERISEGILGRVRIIIHQISETLPEILPKLQEGISLIVQELVPIIVELTPILVEAALTLFLALLEGLAKASPQIVEGLIQLVMKLIELIPKYLPQILNATVTLLGGILQGIVQGIAPAMTKMNELGEGLLQSIGNFFGSMFNAGVQLINSIIEGFWATGDSMGSFFSSLLDGAYQTVVNFAGWFYNAGVSILNGLINGIAAGFQSAFSWMAWGMDTLRSYLPFSPAKRGAFSGRGWTLYSGQAMMEGLAEGIEENARKAEAAMGKATTDIYGAADGEISLGVKAGVSTTNNAMVSELQSLREDIRNMKLQLAIDGRAFAAATVGEMDAALNTRIARTVYA